MRWPVAACRPRRPAFLAAATCQGPREGRSRRGEAGSGLGAWPPPEAGAACGLPLCVSARGSGRARGRRPGAVARGGGRERRRVRWAGVRAAAGDGESREAAASGVGRAASAERASRPGCAVCIRVGLGQRLKN